MGSQQIRRRPHSPACCGPRRRDEKVAFAGAEIPKTDVREMIRQLRRGAGERVPSATTDSGATTDLPSARSSPASSPTPSASSPPSGPSPTSSPPPASSSSQSACTKPAGGFLELHREEGPCPTGGLAEIVLVEVAGRRTEPASPAELGWVIRSVQSAEEDAGGVAVELAEQVVDSVGGRQ